MKNLNCKDAVADLQKYLYEKGSYCNIDLVMVEKIFDLGVDLKPCASRLLIAGLEFKRDDIVQFVYKHCDLDMVTSQIVDKINEIVKKN